MSKFEGGSTKRRAYREKRQKQERRQRLLIILGVTAAALVIAAIIFIPSYLQSRQPVGEITEIAPREWPSPEGLAIGDPEAPVTIEIFEDFQCSSCYQFWQQIEPQVIENMVEPGQVRYVFRHYPFLDDYLGRAGESDQSANASMCANEQGRFWDYHDMLFTNWAGENQGAFRDARLVAFAEALDLDMEAFQACFDENRYRDEIEADRDLGDQMGVQGTPSVFVNGEIVSPGYVPSYDQIDEAVQAALAAGD